MGGLILYGACNGGPGIVRNVPNPARVVEVARSGVCVTLSEISLSFFSGIQFFLQFVSYFRTEQC